MQDKNKNKKGFTLIELMVVIGIIGILSSLILVSLNLARSRARDGQRRNDIKQIMTALELYYASNGEYPNTSNGVGKSSSPNDTWFTSSDSSWATFTAKLAPYLSLPKDPKQSASGWPGTANTYGYSYFSLKEYGCQNQNYMLVYRLENTSGIMSPGVTFCEGTSFNYGNGTITTGVSGR
ncbi:MAG: type II secretion system protein [bacterium]|nr:type II secretion system protein [bacterium]